MQALSQPRDEKEDKILAAARDSFLGQGYAATSMDSVAQAARASKTTLYTRFPSKEALFSATIVRECQAYGLDFLPQEFADLDVEEALYRIGRRFVDMISSDICARVEQIVLGEAPRFPEVARTFEREGPERVTAAVAAYFADAVARGLLEVEDPAFAGSQFLATLKGPCQHAIMLQQRSPLADAERDAFVRKVVTLFLNGARKRD